MLIAPALGMVDLAALSRHNARIDHGAALRTKAHRRLRAAMIKIVTGIGCHLYLLNMNSSDPRLAQRLHGSIGAESVIKV
jgi:hypothetical protein